jgi:thiamine pyrophosphate-dependent acetolactate synthase large subunit-like protein
MAHVGDLLAELLVQHKVTHVFGQPGGQTAALYGGITAASRPSATCWSATNAAPITPAPTAATS